MRYPVTFLAAAWWLSLSSSSYAYLDPGTGSILLQGLIGGIASGMFIARVYWAKVRDYFDNSTTSNDK